MKIDFKFNLRDVIDWYELGQKMSCIIIGCNYDFHRGKYYELFMLNGENKFDVIEKKEEEIYPYEINNY